jgi:GNAT superfamily N-acetyltransferase
MAANTSIRRAVLPDLPYFYEICLKTGNSGNDASELFYDPFALGQYYAAPYLLYQESVCFVVEQELYPQGYIIAVPDTIAFNRWMEESWLPHLRRRYPKPFPAERIRSQEEGAILSLFHEPLFPLNTTQPWLASYPAHLHIDLLPAVQGKGWGRALMDTLCTELCRRSVPGVHLGVGVKNTGAAAFYKKMGFSVLAEETWGFTLGKTW